MDLIAEYTDDDDDEQVDNTNDSKTNVNNLINDVHKIALQSSHINEAPVAQKIGYSNNSSDSDSSSDDSFAASIQKLTQKPLQTNHDSSASSSEDDENENKKERSKKLTYPKTKGEVAPDEIPDPEFELFKLDIKQPIASMGLIHSLVGNIIVVRARKHTIALDEETILFNSQRDSIGKVFETFGPVSEPYYSIRVKAGEVEKFKLNDEVFYAPESLEFTKYIFDIDKLKAQKGSDASWLNDNEPPEECIDYSDDEEERNMRAKLKQSKQKNVLSDEKDFNSSKLTPRGMQKSQSMSNNNFGQKRKFAQSASTQNVTQQQPQPLMNQNFHMHPSNNRPPFMFPYPPQSTQYPAQFHANQLSQAHLLNNQFQHLQQQKSAQNFNDNRSLQNGPYKKSF